MKRSSRTYAGVAIYLTGNGNYEATINGQRVVTRTLAEMRKRIDEANKAKVAS